MLHNSQLSNCCARIRIAASLKNIPLELVEPPEGQKSVLEDPIYQRKNPNAKLPILKAHYGNGEPLIMTQSISMLQFLEETYPSEARLIPPVTEMATRCKVMDLALLVACDIQPLQSSRALQVLKRLSFNRAVRGLSQSASIGWDQNDTANHIRLVRKSYTTPITAIGMKAYEATAKQSAGRFSVGDSVSIADICLVVMMNELLRVRRAFNVDEENERFPTIGRILKSCAGIDAFRLHGPFLSGLGGRIHYKRVIQMKHS